MRGWVTTDGGLTDDPSHGGSGGPVVREVVVRVVRGVMAGVADGVGGGGGSRVRRGGVYFLRQGLQVIHSFL